MKKAAISIGFALVAAILAIGAGLLPFVQTIELKTYDWRMQQTARPTAPADDIVLISIDDDSVRRMAPLVGRWPWPRLVHADLIDYLAAAPAKLVVYDVLFTEPDLRSFSIGDMKWTGAESDAEFAKSVAKAGNVIGPGEFFGEMSMLTGDPRIATVRALDDTRTLEISAERFRALAIEQPDVVEHISRIVSARRAELDEVRAAAVASAAATAAPRSLLARIQRFLRLP